MGKTKIILKKTILEKALLWGVALLILILPLVYFPGWAAAYVTSKQYVLTGAVDVLVALTAWLMATDERYRLSKKNWLYLLPSFVFLLSLTISSIHGVFPQASFFSTVESGTGMVVLYHCFLLAVIVTSLIRVQQKSAIRVIARAVLISSTILAYSTFFTGLNGVVYLDSPMFNGSSGGAMMGNSLLVGAYFVFSFFLGLYLICNETAPEKRIPYCLCLLLMVISPICFNAGFFKDMSLSVLFSKPTLVLGEARIATVSIATGLLITLFTWLSVQNERYKKNMGIAGIVSLIVIGSFVTLVICTPTSALSKAFVWESGNRVTDWSEAIQGIKEKPLLGWGQENYHVVFQKYLDTIVFSPGHGNEVWALHPHNNSLEVLVNGGVIGFSVYMLLLVGIFIALYRLHRKEKISNLTYAIFMGMLVAFILQQQMIYESVVSYTMFFCVVAMLAGLSSTTDQAHQFGKSVPRLYYILACTVSVSMVVVFYYCAYLPAEKVEEFQTITTLTSDARTPLYDHLFNSPGSYAIDTDPEFYIQPLFYSYYHQKEELKSNPLYDKVASEEIQALVTVVDPLWDKNYYDCHLALSMVHLENLEFYLNGDPEVLANADEYAQRGFVLSPDDPQMYTAYAQTLVYENKIPEAKVLLKKAIQLNRNYSSARHFLGLLEKKK